MELRHFAVAGPNVFVCPECSGNHRWLNPKSILQNGLIPQFVCVTGLSNSIRFVTKG
jgi:hypothetical protein